MTRQAYLGEFELMVLLAAIRLGDDAYGVPIAREIEARSRREVALGSVYAALDRLEEKGLVTSRLGDPTAARGGRAKRCYRLEALGERALQESAATAKRVWEAVEEALSGRRPKWNPVRPK